MELSGIARLLEPFLADSALLDAPQNPFLNDGQLSLISTYLDLLLRWNARINLTAVRDPEEIITRHFGESLFAARTLFPPESDQRVRALDLGSGAGFPGVPIKIFAPGVHLTLIESNNKKATFLRELVRKLELDSVEVFANRAERFSGIVDLVILRAVENFQSALATARKLISSNGRIAILIGESQLNLARKVSSEISWNNPVPVPLSHNRTLLTGEIKTLKTQESNKVE